MDFRAGALAAPTFLHAPRLDRLESQIISAIHIGFFESGPQIGSAGCTTRIRFSESGWHFSCSKAVFRIASTIRFRFQARISPAVATVSPSLAKLPRLNSGDLYLSPYEAIAALSFIAGSGGSMACTYVAAAAATIFVSTLKRSRATSHGRRLLQTWPWRCAAMNGRLDPSPLRVDTAWNRLWPLIKLRPRA